MVTPGFGGRVYFPTSKGFVTMEVMSAPPSEKQVFHVRNDKSQVEKAWKPNRPAMRLGTNP
jgi:hypothetical protein